MVRTVARRESYGSELISKEYFEAVTGDFSFKDVDTLPRSLEGGG